MFKWFQLMNSFHVVHIASGLNSAVATVFSASLSVLPYSGEVLPPPALKSGELRVTVTRGSSGHLLQLLKEELRWAHPWLEFQETVMGRWLGIQREGEYPFFF